MLPLKYSCHIEHFMCVGLFVVFILIDKVIGLKFRDWLAYSTFFDCPENEKCLLNFLFCIIADCLCFFFDYLSSDECNSNRLFY